MAELPEQIRQRFRELKLPPADVLVLADDLQVAQFFDRALAAGAPPKAAANWVMGDITAFCKVKTLSHKLLPNLCREKGFDIQVDPAGHGLHEYLPFVWHSSPFPWNVLGHIARQLKFWSANLEVLACCNICVSTTVRLQASMYSFTGLCQGCSSAGVPSFIPTGR